MIKKTGTGNYTFLCEVCMYMRVTGDADVILDVYNEHKDCNGKDL